MKKLFIIALIIFVNVPLVSAKSIGSIEEIKKLTSEVMKKIGSGEIKAGLEIFRSFLLFPEVELDSMLNKIDQQLPIINQRFGKAMGYDFINEEEFGDSLIQLMFIQKFERHLLVWRFIFYKPKSEWLLNTFYFNDKVKPLFK